MPIVVDHVAAAYGGHPVLFDVSLVAHDGECLGIFGHNGAGKSTLLRVMAGVMPVASGFVSRTAGEADGRSLLVRLVPQEEMVFDHLSVRENLLLGLWDRDVPWRTATQRLEPVYAFLPALVPLARRRAGTLSGGERRLVALGRALVADPDVLLLDEPSLGLSPAALELVLDKVSSLRGHKTIVLVEQNLPAALALVQRYYILRQGEVIDEAAADHGRPSLERLAQLV